LWTPLAWTDADRAVRGNHNYKVIARLKPGADVKRAGAEMSTISTRLEQEYPGDDKGWGAKVVALRDELVGDVRPALLVLLGAVGFVLLIACANVANLVLVKTLARQKEIAIRTALGASSIRVARQILSETLLLAFTGGVLGLTFAHFGVKVIVAFLAESLPRTTDIEVDGWVLVFTLTVSLLTGVAAGLVPAVRASKGNLNDSLKQGLGRTDADSGGNRTRSVLVVSEVALSLVLLIGAGLMIRSLARLRSLDPGFDSHNVLTMSIALSPTRYEKPVQQAAFYDQLLQRVRSVPGVASAGAIDSLPLGGGGSTEPIAIEGHPAVAMSEQPEVAVRTVEPGYFETMRIPLLQGRGLASGDVADRPAVILISDQASKLIVDRTMPLHHSIPVIDDLFNLTYIRNTGAAFGIFAGSAEVFRRPFLIVVSIVASGFIVTLLRRLPERETGLITALTFILGGAIGNLIDRLIHGEVIDFLDFFWSGYHWPAFNIADSFITVGVAITIFYLIRAKGEDPFARAS
jgi:predicted permease